MRVDKLSKSDNIELQIQRLLIDGSPASNAVAHIISLYSQDMQKHRDQSVTIEELSAISTFFLNAGFYIELNNFLTKAVSNKLEIPWGHYCESIFSSSAIVSEGIKSAILEGAEHTNLLDQLSRSQKLDFYEEKLKVIRENRIAKLEAAREHKKQDLLSDYQTLQAQGLTEDANEILDKLWYGYSDDPSLADILKKRKHAAAVQKLEKKIIEKKGGPYLPIEIYQTLDPESQKILENIDQSIRDVIAQDPNPLLTHDLTIAHVMMENYNAALALTPSLAQNQTEIPENILWLRFEVLFQLRKFVELLEEIKIIESVFANNPDATVALSYLKALCLWELDERDLAIQTMESILFIRPQYKSAAAYLSEWKAP